MIIWQGYGWLVAVIAFACLMLTQHWVNSLQKNPLYYASHGWPKLVALLIASGVVYAIGKKLEQRPGKVVIDKETRQEIELRPKHTLFFIRMVYWGPILAVIGVVFFFLK